MGVTKATGMDCQHHNEDCVAERPTWRQPELSFDGGLAVQIVGWKPTEAAQRQSPKNCSAS